MREELFKEAKQEIINQKKKELETIKVYPLRKLIAYIALGTGMLSLLSLFGIAKIAYHNFEAKYKKRPQIVQIKDDNLPEILGGKYPKQIPAVVSMEDPFKYPIYKEINPSKSDIKEIESKNTEIEGLAAEIINKPDMVKVQQLRALITSVIEKYKNSNILDTRLLNNYFKLLSASENAFSKNKVKTRQNVMTEFEGIKKRVEGSSAELDIEYILGAIEGNQTILSGNKGESLMIAPELVESNKNIALEVAIQHYLNSANGDPKRVRRGYFAAIELAEKEERSDYAINMILQLLKLENNFTDAKKDESVKKALQKLIKNYVKINDYAHAKEVLDKYKQKYPSDTIGKDLMEIIAKWTSLLNKKIDKMNEFLLSFAEKVQTKIEYLLNKNSEDAYIYLTELENINFDEVDKMKIVSYKRLAKDKTKEEAETKLMKLLEKGKIEEAKILVEYLFDKNIYEVKDKLEKSKEIELEKKIKESIWKEYDVALLDAFITENEEELSISQKNRLKQKVESMYNKISEAITSSVSEYDYENALKSYNIIKNLKNISQDCIAKEKEKIDSIDPLKILENIERAETDTKKIELMNKFLKHYSNHPKVQKVRADYLSLKMKNVEAKIQEGDIEDLDEITKLLIETGKDLRQKGLRADKSQLSQKVSEYIERITNKTSDRYKIKKGDLVKVVKKFFESNYYSRKTDPEIEIGSDAIVEKADYENELYSVILKDRNLFGFFTYIELKKVHALGEKYNAIVPGDKVEIVRALKGDSYSRGGTINDIPLHSVGIVQEKVDGVYSVSINNSKYYFAPDEIELLKPNQKKIDELKSALNNF